MGQGSIIGYEINEKTCQISFYNEKDLEPDTLEVDTDNYQIPLIIGKLRDTWAYGKEAKRLVTIKDGFTATRLLSKSLAGDKIEVWRRNIRRSVAFISIYSDVASVISGDRRYCFYSSVSFGRNGADAQRNRRTDEY